MKRFLILFFVCFSAFGYSQIIAKEGLWKAQGVLDGTGERMDIYNQEFIKFKDSSFVLLSLGEELSMETGEVSLRSRVVNFSFGRKLQDQTYEINLNGETYQLKQVRDKVCHLIFPDFTLVFNKIDDLAVPSFSKDEFEQFIVGSTFYEVDLTSKVNIGSVKMHYQSDENVRCQEVSSTNHWESAYKIIDFEGYTFLRGITSPPILLTSIFGNELNALEVDPKIDPKKILLSKSPSPIETESGKPFVLAQAAITTDDCLAKLTPKQKAKKIKIAKGIIESDLLTDEVQHDYNCKFMLFHNKTYDGSATVTVEKLLEIDPSLCYVLEIPCGYYAIRASKTDSWYIYLHEERMETDSSYIIKKAFHWNNTYRVINELKGQEVVHYQDYYMDTKVRRRTWTYLKGKEVGISYDYDRTGRLEKSVDHTTGKTINY